MTPLTIWPLAEEANNSEKTIDAKRHFLFIGSHSSFECGLESISVASRVKRFQFLIGPNNRDQLINHGGELRACEGKIEFIIG